MKGLEKSKEVWGRSSLACKQRIKDGEKEEGILSRHCGLIGDQKGSKEHWLSDQKTTICKVGEGDCPGTER